jgi:TonB-dependent SusC/RagA subfamily outer membrane receptor
MRKYGRGPMRTVACVLAVTAMTGCQPLSPHSDEPMPDTTISRRTGTASNSAWNRGEDSKEVYSRVEELIEGRAPGVQVLHLANGGFALRIRGLSSPTGGNDPLIVIDGTESGGGNGNGALAALNPQDVVRIEVLKDAASTAFYGMRGANGVIVITTRRQ